MGNRESEFNVKESEDRKSGGQSSIAIDGIGINASEDITRRKGEQSVNQSNSMRNDSGE